MLEFHSTNKQLVVTYVGNFVACPSDVIKKLNFENILEGINCIF